MKFVSLFFFAALMTGTWMMSHGKRQVPERVHADVQRDLRQIIADLLKENAPRSKNLVFQRIYTHADDASHLTATFRYTFDDAGDDNEPTHVGISGTASLEKVSEVDDVSTWKLSNVKLSDSEVEFAEPLIITATPKTTK